MVKWGHSRASSLKEQSTYVSACACMPYITRVHIHIYINVHLPRKMLRAHGAASISDLTNSSYYAHTHTSIYIWWWWDTTWHENLCVCDSTNTKEQKNIHKGNEWELVLLVVGGIRGWESSKKSHTQTIFSL